MRNDIKIRPECIRDFDEIDKLVLDSFSKGTDYSDGRGEVALIHEIRLGKYYIPELSYVAELNGIIVGHFMFSHFPLSKVSKLGNYDKEIVETPIVMLTPVSVHSDYLRQNIGSTMILLGMEKVKKLGYKGIQVEGNPKFYNTLGFETSSKYNIFATSGWPLQEPKCMMVQETYLNSLNNITGYVDYSMYENA
ncbi:N-acetyltransferase [Paludicola sp. MB14-C6]|uniref:GNAT family N-acetyltransferase n=1 Tax=Paludihabitans sp. MB14-C6 TaxID=3070656 RepID=UPI0027DBA5D7|nr:N-acetyltransferase [Paludicola sp. MB14-C6]WMJ22121.1 N-acetyltransferase [Paludicola sp. MB14-C6]